MTLPFPSAEWIAAYREEINSSVAYKQASTEWTHGAVALVVNPQPAIGLAEPVGIWLDLDRGVCRAARLVPATEAAGAPFVLTSDYARWKQVIRKELAPVAGSCSARSRSRLTPDRVRFINPPKARESGDAGADAVPG